MADYTLQEKKKKISTIQNETERKKGKILTKQQ